MNVLHDQIYELILSVSLYQSVKSGRQVEQQKRNKNLRSGRNFFEKIIIYV